MLELVGGDGGVRLDFVVRNEPDKAEARGSPKCATQGNLEDDTGRLVLLPSQIYVYLGMYKVCRYVPRDIQYRCT